MRILVAEDDVKMAGLLKRGLEEEGYAVDVAANRRRGAVGRDREPVRRDPARRHASRPRRPGGLSPAADGEPMGASPHADGARRRPRPRRPASTRAPMTTSRSRSRSASSLRASARSMRRGPSERPAVLAPATWQLDPASKRVTRGKARRRADAEGVRAARVLPAPPRRGAQPHPADRARVGLRLRGRLERRRRVRPLPAREDRPPVRASLDRNGAWRGLSAAGGRRRMRLPIRARLTLVSGALMAVVLIALGSFVFLRIAGGADRGGRCRTALAG